MAPKPGDLVTVEPHPALPVKPKSPDGAIRGFKRSGGETYEYSNLMKALEPKGLKICANTEGSLYSVCPMTDAAIKNRRVGLEARPQASPEDQTEQPAPAADGGGGSGASGDDGGGLLGGSGAFDSTTGAKREEYSADKIFCGGASVKGKFGSYTVAEKRIGLRKCERLDIAKGDGGDLSAGVSLKKNVGAQVSVEGRLDGGFAPDDLAMRGAVELAQPVGDAAKGLRRGFLEKLRKAEEANGL